MTNKRPEFRPTASIETLQARGLLLHRLRNWFVEQGYWECQTPVLSSERILDANIDLFTVRNQVRSTLYLQSSPEACMKRLLAAGADAIFQIGPAMRLAESGRCHNPEFTIAEWYKVGASYQDQMTFTEQLVRHVYDQTPVYDQMPVAECSPRKLSDKPFDRITYDEAFEKYAGQRVLELAPEELLELARSNSVAIPEGMPANQDLLLNLLLAELVEPQLGREQPQFLYDYPASQAALSQVCNHATGPSVAQRFELYDRGIELCNGYQELTDPVEIIKRSQSEAHYRDDVPNESHSCLPQSQVNLPERLIAAMESGLPECSGVALGFDRLVMLALGCESISEVVAFPTDQA